MTICTRSHGWERGAGTLMLALFLMVALSVNAVAAPTITVLGTLGGVSNQAYGINESGQVVGNAVNAQAKTHAVIYNNNGATMQDLGTLLSPYNSSYTNNSWGYAINDSGEVAGWADAGGYGLAWRYSGTTIQSLGRLGGYGSVGYGINNAGDVVGNSGVYDQYDNRTVAFAVGDAVPMHDLGNFIATGLYGSYASAVDISNHGVVVGVAGTYYIPTQAFKYDGTMHPLGTLGGAHSAANAISDAGIVVGWANTSQGATHAFMYDGTMHDLGTLGVASNAYAINETSQIVGSYDVSGGGTHAFLYSSGTMVDLNSLLPNGSGWTSLDVARGINDHGQIVGWGTYNGQTRGFLMDVNAPEPSSASLLLLMAGVGALSLLRRKLGETRERSNHSQA